MTFVFQNQLTFLQFYKRSDLKRIKSQTSGGNLTAPDGIIRSFNLSSFTSYILFDFYFDFLISYF